MKESSMTVALGSESQFEPVHFSVDAALLRELGERLVGKSHIALAELIKNSYDADATEVEVKVGADSIEVVDNGHGMTDEAFRAFWMRIGTPHKQGAEFSPKYKRRMTGSKGVGRLSVQFLAKDLEMWTSAASDATNELIARVDWESAVERGDLTEAEAHVAHRPRTTEFPGGSPHGTRIKLSRLNQGWTADDFRELARDVWPLQPPFRTIGAGNDGFAVRLETGDEEASREFGKQMSAILDIWYAKVSGRLVLVPDGEPTVQFGLEFAGGQRMTFASEQPGCPLHRLEFEIRVYQLNERQPRGVSVGVAREYMNEYGGVHIYDAGFHLPYYGPKSDWLQIEIDHSHRLAKSKLLPDAMQVTDALNWLPTNSRLFGVVHVDTADEIKAAGRERPERSLMIQVSRDRLVDNAAYRSLVKIVRYAIDLYANEEARRQTARVNARRPTEPIRKKAERIEEVLDRHAADLPPEVSSTLRQEIADVVRSSETAAEAVAKQVGLLGALATAGISTVAYEHEFSKQVRNLEGIVEDLEGLRSGDSRTQAALVSAASRLRSWLERASGTRALFLPLLNEEDREVVGRYPASRVVEEVLRNSRVLLRGMTIEAAGVDPGLRLPAGKLVEWNAIFQNVLVNAANATVESAVRMVSIRSRLRGRERELLVCDTGSGVDLASSEELFQPFERRLRLAPERQALGLGGTGLGLTIVRLIAENVGCSVGFVEPPDGFRTAFRLRWRE